MASPKDPSPRPAEVPAAREAPPLPPCLRAAATVPWLPRSARMLLIASGVGPTEAARLVGVSSESIRKWRLKAEAEGTMPSAPKATDGSAPAPEPSMPTPSVSAR